MPGKRRLRIVIASIAFVAALCTGVVVASADAPPPGAAVFFTYVGCPATGIRLDLRGAESGATRFELRTAGAAAPFATRIVGAKQWFGLTYSGPFPAEVIVTANGAVVWDHHFSALDDCWKGQVLNWRDPTFSDDFSRPDVSTADWYLYDFPNDKNRRVPALLQPRTGGGTSELQLVGTHDPTGTNLGSGMSSRHSQKYGRWEVRARFEAGRGFVPVILLWPDGNRWPSGGEIDIAEGWNWTRQSVSSFTHNGADNHATGFAYHYDFTQWHTFAVDWLPDHVTYFIDGVPQYTLRTDPDPAKNYVPSTEKMHLVLQNDEYDSRMSSTTPRTVTMHVDWVRQYAPLSSWRY